MSVIIVARDILRAFDLSRDAKDASACDAARLRTRAARAAAQDVMLMPPACAAAAI